MWVVVVACWAYMSCGVCSLSCWIWVLTCASRCLDYLGLGVEA